jgi:CDP-diacylglycerol--serine O-phosphatidyltransferase
MPILAKIAESRKRTGRPRRLRSLAVFPTLLTLANLLCGFAAIHFGLRAMYELGAGIPSAAGETLKVTMLERMMPSFLSVGAGLVIVGMVFDCFDGLVARATRSTTNFGGQLDSLADVVTCGVAPATLMLAFITTQLAVDSIFPSPISEHFLGRATWIAAAVYVAFAAVRLARFNVEHAQADFDYRTFRGLPSPGAACIVVSMIILQDQMGDTGRRMIAYSLPLVALAAASLMVSRIPYRRVHRAYLVGKRPFGQLVTALLLFAVFWTWKAPTLLVFVLWYGASGPTFWLWRRIRGSHRVSQPAAAESSQHSDQQTG